MSVLPRVLVWQAAERVVGGLLLPADGEEAGLPAAQALLVAADLVERNELAELKAQRYAGWDDRLGTAILDGTESLESLGARVAAGEIDPRPVSGQQERLENIVNRSTWATDPARVKAGAGR